MKNISTWTWGDYHWFLSGIHSSQCCYCIIPKAGSQKTIFFIPSLSLFLFVENLRPFGGDVLSQALKLYNSSTPCPINDRCPERLYTTLVSDMRVSCPSNRLATRAAGPQKHTNLKISPFLIWLFSYYVIHISDII